MGTVRLFNHHFRLSFVFLALCEACIFCGSIYLAIAIRFSTLDFNSEELILSIGSIPYKALVFTIVQMLSMISLGLYQIDQFRENTSFLQIISRIFLSMVLASIFLMVVYYILPSSQIGRGVYALALLLSLTFVIIARRIFDLTANEDIFTSRVLIIGIGKSAATFLGIEERPSTSRFKIKGFVGTPGQTRVVPEDVIVDIGNSLLAKSRALGIDEIVVVLDDRRKGFPVQHLLDCKLAGIKITDPVSFLEREQGKVNLALLNPSWMIFSDGFTVSLLKTTISRLFDIVASLSIVIITAPILLLTAFLIALEGGFKQPVFYRQERVGKNGQSFNLLKFRSMQVNAEKGGAQWASQNDARVTRIGKFIRKVRIDELPQILNILKGDMRLVGPRPERPEFVSKLSKSITMYSQRLSVKPGLAGWAQLKYPYGATEEDAYEKLQYDLYYIKNANPVMDFFILLQTLEVVLFGKGAR